MKRQGTRFARELAREKLKYSRVNTVSTRAAREFLRVTRENLLYTRVHGARVCQV